MEGGGSHMNVSYNSLLFHTGYTVDLKRFRNLMSIGLYFVCLTQPSKDLKYPLTTFFLKEILISRWMYHQENLHKNNTIITKNNAYWTHQSGDEWFTTCFLCCKVVDHIFVVQLLGNVRFMWRTARLVTESCDIDDRK